MPVVFNVLCGLPQALSSIQMILICVVTDVLPALSLVYEQPEADLLLRKPRDRKKDRLADPKLICHAYFFIGMLESLAAMTGYVRSLAGCLLWVLIWDCSRSAFYFGFQRGSGIKFSQLWLKYGGTGIDPDLLAEATNRAQSICQLEFLFTVYFSDVLTDFFTLIMMQWFNLLSTRTRRMSIFQQNPFGSSKTRNLYLIPAMLGALVLGMYVLSAVFLI